MTTNHIKLDGYDIIRGKDEDGLRFRFYVWRKIVGNTFLASEHEYFSDAARYVAHQKGIDGDFRIGYVEALIQIYQNG